MPEMTAVSERVDRYVRGKLSEHESAQFETELLDSAELQDELEAALALKAAVTLFDREQDSKVTPLPLKIEDSPQRSSQWRNWAVAASVLLAVVSTSALYRSELENQGLQTRLATLAKPVGQVITIPVNIMRSLDTQAASVRLVKPDGAAMLVLDIELTRDLASAKQLDLQLGVQGGEVLHQWQAVPASTGQLKTALQAEILPTGMLELTMTDAASGASDIRRIELL